MALDTISKSNGINQNQSLVWFILPEGVKSLNQIVLAVCSKAWRPAVNFLQSAIAVVSQ